MKLVIGLGNPGKKFEKNRHNAGKMFVGAVRGFEEFKGVKFLEADCFMNESGEFVKRAVRGFDLQDLYIVHDDLDIPLGQFKIQFGVGPKVHNGILSVEKALGTADFWRVRIGIDSRKLKLTGEQYVLADFEPEEEKILSLVFDRVVEELVK